jgi:OOP family OmpA-OmpF porin
LEETVSDNIYEQIRKVINDSADEFINSDKEHEEDQQQDSKKQLATPSIKWDRYDFIPGDEIIFADGPSRDEENG